MEQNEVVGKVSGSVFKWLKLAWAWSVSFVTVRTCSFSLRKARKNLDANNARLGMEFYSLYRRGETEILKAPVIMQQLKTVEEAESQVLDLQARIESVREEYRQKRDAISSKQD